MAFTFFSAGSGDYQKVRPLNINPSSVPANNVSVETFSVAAANIATNGGSIKDFTKDAIVRAEWANPLASTLVGLIIIDASIPATGVLQLSTFNPTGSTISPAAGTQINLIVL